MGQTGQHMYIVSIGDVFAFDSSGKILFDFKPGAIFGEYAALRIIGGRLFHTQCRTMCEMCTITIEDLEDVFACVPNAMESIIGRARHSFTMTVNRFGLQHRANMLRHLMTRTARPSYIQSVDECKDDDVCSSSPSDHTERKMKAAAASESQEKATEEIPAAADALRAVIREELAPLRQKIERLERTMSEADQTVPHRHRMSAPHQHRTYRPSFVSPSAERNLHMRVRRNSALGGE